MTNAEKLILKDEKAKKAVTDVLKIFDGESYKFAADCLKSANYFLNVDSHFNLKNALKNISSLDGSKKKLNFVDARKIFDAVLAENYAREYFRATLNHAKATNYADDVLTLTFDRQPIASHFENSYRKSFEESASKIFGRKITLEIENED